MLSNRCQRNLKVVIPKLLEQYHGGENDNNKPIDLSQAENHLMQDQVLTMIQREIKHNLSAAHLSYPSGIGGDTRAREALADFLNSHFMPVRSVQPQHIILTSGSSEALSTLIFHLCDPGDGVLISTPYWSGLDLALESRCRSKVIPVNIPLEEVFTATSVEYYETALAASDTPIKALLVCNPHNPLGRCYPVAVLQALLEFCQRHAIHYISDEVYGMSVFGCSDDNRDKFHSLLSLDVSEDLLPLTHTVYSLSKDFACSGIRIGMIVDQGNKELCLGSALIANASVSTLTTILVPSLLNPSTVQEFLSVNNKRLAGAYQTIRGFLVQRGLKFSPVQGGLGVFACLLKRAPEEGESLLRQALADAGVNLVPGKLYHFKEPCWFRIVFSVDAATLREALRRIGEALDQVEETQIQRQAKELMKRTPLIDGHNDWANLIRGYYHNQIQSDCFLRENELIGHVDIVRLRKGHIGGVFWSAFVDCPTQDKENIFAEEGYHETIKETLQQIDLIMRLIRKYPNDLQLATSSKEAREVFAAGKIASMIGIEGFHQIGNSFSILRTYYNLGVRYATLTHNHNNMFADSATSKCPAHNGLSTEGKLIIHEMNYIGMMVDLSHTSECTAVDVLRHTLAPVIFSHSSCYAIQPHCRNVTDKVLHMLKVNNGLVMVTFIPELASGDAKSSCLMDIVKHITYIGDLIGYDHVGIGSDFDGMAKSVQGLEDVSKLPDLVAELLRQGVQPPDVEKILGLNVLRVMEMVESVARQRAGFNLLELEDIVKPLWDDRFREEIALAYPNALPLPR